MTRKEVLDAAASAVLKDRQATHGKPEQSFTTIAGFWNTYLTAINRPLLPHDIAIMMALFKYGRLSTNPQHEDNWTDAIGYPACGCELATHNPVAQEVTPPKFDRLPDSDYVICPNCGQRGTLKAIGLLCPCCKTAILT